jgi:hypothetical protein
MMETGWKKVFGTTHLMQAEWLKSVLEENGIAAVVLNKRDSALTVGEIELYVQPDNVMAALNLIEKSEHENLDNAQ